MPYSQTIVGSVHQMTNCNKNATIKNIFISLSENEGEQKESERASEKNGERLAFNIR
jgi:hypothetical protein